MSTTTRNEDIIRGVQNYCADLLEAEEEWNEADGCIIAGMLNTSDDPWGLFRHIDEETGAIDVGYRTLDGRPWFSVLRQMRNQDGSGLLENLRRTP